MRLGLGYVKGVLADEVRELVAERERGGRFRDLGELAARAATRRGTLEQLPGPAPARPRGWGATGSLTGRSTEMKMREIG